MADFLRAKGLFIYPKSIRRLDSGNEIFVARRENEKLVGITKGNDFQILPLSWENYKKLRSMLPLAPTPCEKKTSFGTGDRLGMVSATHLSVLSKYDVFPVIAQQSPRELAKTSRNFKDVLLKAVLGVLESGYTGKWGADADHIKDEQQLLEAIDAGYSMYTLDISDWLDYPPRRTPAELSPLSRKIVANSFNLPPICTAYKIDNERLIDSALIYEHALNLVKHFHRIIKKNIANFDLEISIDECPRDTTPEDHYFVAEFLHLSGVEFTSLAPKFPGRFQKGVDFGGDLAELATSLHIHATLCRSLGGYRLSLHSGSDKFSVYPLLSETTDGAFHIKTSGTSWLQAVKVISEVNLPLFRELYMLCLENLEESKKAYQVSVELKYFPKELPNDIRTFLQQPDVRQLFHISYGALLDQKREEIYKTLFTHEEKHYSEVAEHIERHLKTLKIKVSES
ncbi:MAG: tagaturonate epimerase family protein [Armatimonadetes bacterium]|nr:tagaturonate epimerase family protein [Armatimonadota bacterium]